MVHGFLALASPKSGRYIVNKKKRKRPRRKHLDRVSPGKRAIKSAKRLARRLAEERRLARIMTARRALFMHHDDLP